MSGDENDENGVNKLTEHRLQSHATTLLYFFIYLFHGINFKQSEYLSCDFIIRLLHNTLSSKSKSFFAVVAAAS